LITGGVRSGKSTYAEALAARAAGSTHQVCYVAPFSADRVDPAGDDPEWRARVAAHRARRPDSWRTVETTDLAGVLTADSDPILIDCLGTWVTALIDELGTWDEPLPTWKHRFDDQLTALLGAWQATDRVIVAVSNEVGWGVVPATRSGRVFADLLGEVNRAVAAVSDQLVLMVAGRPLIIPAAGDQ
jgi:adenosylcobinamide kinase/adenosylcobinamide-phosphate guanylyltransferase